MSFSLSNRALLRGMLAGAVALTGTACSRSDRTESGRDNSATVLPDTSSAQPSGGTTTGAVSGSDKDAAGYRPMERDTTSIPSQDSDSARVTSDTAETSSVSSDTSVSQTAIGTDTAAIDTAAGADVSEDTTAAGYVEMARDTSTVAEQADTAATPSGDVAMQATIDTSSQANADVSAETEVAVDEAADETADEQMVRPEGRETVAASETQTDEVGAAATGGDVTGAEAVALLSREGVRCAVVDPEVNEAVRWDMSNTPVTLNPCGMGSMVLSRIWTEK